MKRLGLGMFVAALVFTGCQPGFLYVPKVVETGEVVLNLPIDGSRGLDFSNGWIQYHLEISAAPSAADYIYSARNEIIEEADLVLIEHDLGVLARGAADGVEEELAGMVVTVLTNSGDAIAIEDIHDLYLSIDDMSVDPPMVD